MRTVTTAYSTANDAKVRTFIAKAEMYDKNSGSLLQTFSQGTKIKQIQINRVGEESKFFGFGVTHRFNIKLIDVDRELDISTNNYFQIWLGLIGSNKMPQYFKFPQAYVTEVHRDENTGELSVTAYDLLKDATAHTFEELNLTAPYTLEDVAVAAAKFLDKADRSEPYNLIGTDIPLTDYIGNEQATVEGDIITLNGTAGFYSTESFEFAGTTNFPAGEYEFRVEEIGTKLVGTGVRHSFTVSGTTELRNLDLDFNASYKAYLSGEKYIRLNIDMGGTTYEDYQVRVIVKRIPVETDPLFNIDDIPGLALEYPNGANLDGTETIKEILDDVAEATQTIYYVGEGNTIRFRRLNISGNPNITISKNHYITLDTGANRRLQTIVSATELGDNISASTTLIGTTQYVKDNPFWDMRDDVAVIVGDAITQVGDMTINQFTCQWRGNIALEPGDKIALTTKDNNTVISYLLNDTITFDGGLSQKTEWHYKEEEESFSNPSNLGDALKQTYAKVDKQNKEIEIVASEASANKQELAALKINTESISASVSKVEEANTDAIASINGELATLTKKVETSITAEDVQIQIKSELSNGVDKVTTATGFTFNEEGLTIAKTGSEMTTNIDEDGMSVFRDNQEVLTADNTGVTAYNLKARTYLIVGENSRFEDFTSADGETRTGCFWIGG